ncbi:hypothetical protein LINPERPRIM_LOCUS25671 [Linum perenne]
MKKELFLRIVESLSNYSEYFRPRVDAANKRGLSPLQKCTAAIRQLAYGTPADHYDEYLRIGSNNDINVLNQSPLFNDVLGGYLPDIQFTVNGTTYTKGYYLADGIYPEWATMVKSFAYPEDPKRKKFKKMQEATRKDVERAFGVLQARWAIVHGAARFWHRQKLKDIMYACVILHNMIVENEGNAISTWSDDDVDPPISVSRGSVEEFHQYLRRHAELRDREVHQQLRADLVEHIWQRFGDDTEH